MSICGKCGRDYGEASYQFCLDCGTQMIREDDLPTLVPADLSSGAKLPDGCLTILALLAPDPDKLGREATWLILSDWKKEGFNIFWIDYKKWALSS